jgi:hypothetical protein
MMEQLDQRVSAATENGKALLVAVREKVEGLNLPAGAVVIPQFEEAQFTLENDLYDGSQTLVASFYPRPRYRAGVLLFHSDGSCFAEFHVMQIHPARPKWFVESVEAWVRDGTVQTDLRLVAMPQ